MKPSSKKLLRLFNKNQDYEKVRCRIDHGRMHLINLDNFKTVFEVDLIYLTKIRIQNDLVIYFVG